MYFLNATFHQHNGYINLIFEKTSSGKDNKWRYDRKKSIKWALQIRSSRNASLEKLFCVWKKLIVLWGFEVVVVSFVELLIKLDQKKVSS